MIHAAPRSDAMETINMMTLWMYMDDTSVGAAKASRLSVCIGTSIFVRLTQIQYIRSAATGGVGEDHYL